MARLSSLWHLAVAAVIMLGRGALALPQADVSTATTAPATSATPITWISVNWEGEATTITPSVITASDGQLTTVSEPPAALTAAATYTISPYGGVATTITGLAPVASQTGTGESLGAVFPVCAASDASEGPFCLPRPDSELHPGSMYYLTWSPTLLNTTLQQQAYLQVWYNHTASSPTHGTTSAAPVNLTAGWLGYPIDLDFFTTFAAEQNVSAADLTRLSLTFVFAWNETGQTQTGGGRHRRDGQGGGEELGTTIGPTVWLTTDTVAGGGIQNGTDGSGSGGGGGVVTAPGSGGETSSGSDSGSGSGSGSVPAAAIAVPVSVVVVVAVLAGACFVSWRRTGHMPFVGPAARAAVQWRRSSAGYGVRRSRSERTGAGGGDSKSETNVGIQLTDRDSWSPTGRSAGPGRNVFREEVARQERLG